MLVFVIKSSTRLHSGWFPLQFWPGNGDKEARGGEKTLRNLSYSYVPPFPKTFTE